MSARTLLALFLLLTATPAAAKGPATDAPQPFVARTHVVVPKQVGDFTLESTSYDPENRAAGVGARFAHPQHPEIRFDIYVYPAGKRPSDEAMATGMEEFLGSLEYAAGQGGTYQDMVILERSAFPLSVGDTGGTVHPPDPTDPYAGMILALRKSAIPGERLAMSLTHLPSHMQMRSLGYLFYHQMYFFKGRVSAAERYIDPPAFEAFADEAMRQLVPAISALNVGGCATVHVPVERNVRRKKREQAEESSVIALIEGMMRVQADNCTGEVSEARMAELSRDSEVVTIEFNPGEWGAP